MEELQLNKKSFSAIPELIFSFLPISWSVLLFLIWCESHSITLQNLEGILSMVVKESRVFVEERWDIVFFHLLLFFPSFFFESLDRFFCFWVFISSCFWFYLSILSGENSWKISEISPNLKEDSNRGVQINRGGMIIENHFKSLLSSLMDWIISHGRGWLFYQFKAMVYTGIWLMNLQNLILPTLWMINGLMRNRSWCCGVFFQCSCTLAGVICCCPLLKNYGEQLHKHIHRQEMMSRCMSWRRMCMKRSKEKEPSWIYWALW